MRSHARTAMNKALAHALSFSFYNSLFHNVSETRWVWWFMRIWKRKWEKAMHDVRVCIECVCVCEGAVVVHIYLFNSAKSSHPHLLLSSLANLILRWVCCVSCSFRIFISGLFPQHIFPFSIFRVLRVWVCICRVLSLLPKLIEFSNSINTLLHC